jgi:fibronectin type 3 domain-containing protein
MGVSWTTPSTGANGYYVYRSTTAGGPYALRGTTSATSFTDGGSFPPATYYYVVTAYKVDKLGNEYVSGYSNEASVRIR